MGPGGAIRKDDLMSKWKVFAALVLALAVVGVGSAAAQQKLTAQDYAEIDQLYARYNFSIDSGDAEGWADTFTPDGVFRGNTEGRAALVELATNFYKGQGGAARHWNTNLVVTPTAEGADGACYPLLWNTGGRPASIIVSTIYRDKLVRTADGWRFKSRTTEVDRPAASGQ